MTSHREEHSREPARTGTVKAPGARLFYQVRGSGPYLMMLGGGAAGVGGFDTVAPYLAADYTLVTYDRRGLSRSPLDDPGKDPAITIATHSEDVHRILTALGA
jgi:pimeloyl-ACP methyl ester carboxylesterase